MQEQQEARFRIIDEMVKTAPPGDWVAYLAENHPLYAGASVLQMTRIKGFILASFEGAGLPGTAMPYVLEELENARKPYLLAAAAKALRGNDRPSVNLLPFLIKALDNLVHGDDSISFDSIYPKGGSTVFTSARQEIFETIEYYKGHGQNMTDAGMKWNCCNEPIPEKRSFGRAGNLSKVYLQDQDGYLLSFKEFFQCGPSIVAFFYTRCDNPNKCSLTITRLAELQNRLKDTPVRIAAITYDPEFDHSHRLKSFCQNRQFRFDERNRAFRVTAGFAELRDYLSLGVNFAGGLVNKHAIELYILDQRAAVAEAHQRLQWDEDKVVNSVRQLFTTTGWRKIMKDLSAIILSLGMAIMPKCPFCVIVYLSALGITGVNAFLQTAFGPLIVLLGLVNITVIWYRSLHRRFYLPLWLSLSGYLLLAGYFLLTGATALRLPGIALLLSGAMVNSMPLRWLNVISQRWTSSWILKSNTR